MKKLICETYNKLKNKSANGNNPLWVFLLLSPFFCGGFFEWASSLFSLFLTGYLLHCFRKSGRLLIRRNLTLAAMAILVAFYGISAVWAVDRGMAAIGFCKFLPYFLFALAVMQADPGERVDLLYTVPLSGSIMAVLSMALGQIPSMEKYFYVNGRLAGFFQYPNTFALFLLAGVIVLVGKGQWDMRRGICLAALLFGIALTGSRTVFFLLLAVAAVFIFTLKSRKSRIVLGALLAVMLAATAVYAALTGDVSAAGRYLTASLESSEFLGRLLYYKDALPVICRHPLGLGYLGYFYTQGSFQTGVYSVMHIHNELLQILLDVGWLPAVVCMAAGIRSFQLKKGDLACRMLLFAAAAHSMLDFDLQFISVGFALLLVMDLENGKAWVIRNKMSIRTACCVLVVVSLWLGTASGLYRFGRNEAAVTVYPGCTGAWVALLPQAENAEDMDCIADEILKRNKSVPLAYDAKARVSFAQGDFEGMIANKQKAISLTKYELEEYLDYFDMLYVGIQLYEANGDVYSAGYCMERLPEIPAMMEDVLEETDSLAWRIYDKPELVLPEEYQELLGRTVDDGT